MYLVADVGGTNMRFALAGQTLDPASISKVKLTAFGSLEEALKFYLAQQGNPTLKTACFAVAAPVESYDKRSSSAYFERHLARRIALVSAPDIAFSRASLAAACGVKRAHIINDWHAMGYTVAGLEQNEYSDLYPQREVVPGAMKAACGPGTGLGTCFVLDAPERVHVIASESQHMTFAPRSAAQQRVFSFLQAKFPDHVSWERLVCGPGLADMHEALSGEKLTPEQVEAKAKAADVSALATVACFLETLAHFAANLALCVNARGGVYIGGNVVNGLKDFIEPECFAAHFAAKGRYEAFLNSVPVRLMSARDPGLKGALGYLQQIYR